MGRSFALSAAVHVVLAAVLFLGVRWQIHPPETVTVDLVTRCRRRRRRWSRRPSRRRRRRPRSSPRSSRRRRWRSPTSRFAEQAQAEAQARAEEGRGQAQARPELREAAARAGRARSRKRSTSSAQERELRELLAAPAGRRRAQGGRGARQRAGRVHRAASRPRCAATGSCRRTCRATREAIFDVVQLPTGEVLSIKLLKSSGNAGLRRRGRARDPQVLAAAAARRPGAFSPRAETYLPSAGQIACRLPQEQGAPACGTCAVLLGLRAGSGGRAGRRAARDHRHRRGRAAHPDRHRALRRRGRGRRQPDRDRARRPGAERPVPRARGAAARRRSRPRTRRSTTASGARAWPTRWCWARWRRIPTAASRCASASTTSSSRRRSAPSPTSSPRSTRAPPRTASPTSSTRSSPARRACSRPGSPTW